MNIPNPQQRIDYLMASRDAVERDLEAANAEIKRLREIIDGLLHSVSGATKTANKALGYV